MIICSILEVVFGPATGFLNFLLGFFSIPPFEPLAFLYDLLGCVA